jgi:hypothetical protein
VSGIYKKLSFSAGYSQYETDGFRINNDQTDKIGNAFAQLEITPNTSIQAEYRYRETENGDLRLRFNLDDFSPNRRIKEETDTIRFGFRHAFSPGSTLIGNFVYSDNQYSADETAEVSVLFPIAPPPVPPLPATLQSIANIDIDEEALSGELSYLFRSEYIDLVSGAGYFDVDSDFVLATQTTIFLPPPIPAIPIPTPTETEDQDVSHTNLYLYSYIKPLENLTFTVGASGDFFESKLSDTEDRDQFNPKFGVIWSPLPNTTLRGAVFRVLKRTLTTDQTLEPTQVAGFNQFFDDANSTDSWRYGAAIDQKFSQSIYGGVEFSKRDQEVPAPVFGSTPDTRVDWEESLGRAYLFWTPHKWLALKAEYVYEKFERDERYVFGIKEAKTHIVPLGINFFHPSGFSAFFGGTYYDQNGDFEGFDFEGFFPGQDDFWVVDAAINYRLPKRYGFITIGATNLFDEEFNYYETDPDNPRIQPDRFIFAKVTLAIP